MASTYPLRRDLAIVGDFATFKFFKAASPGRQSVILPVSVRRKQNEEVVPVNESTWVLPSGVTAGR